MSLDPLSTAVLPCPSDETDSLDWLKDLLRSAMEGVMATEEGTPIQKANALVRLGNLYLKTGQVTELKQANKGLIAHIEELGQANQALAARIVELQDRHTAAVRGEAHFEVAAPAGEAIAADEAGRAASGIGDPGSGQALLRSPDERAPLRNSASAAPTVLHPRMPLSSPGLTRAPRKNGPNWANFALASSKRIS
jgi:hypothetical protein